MTAVRYDLEPRGGSRMAVIRTGPKGGKRTVAVYRTLADATRVQQVLTLSARAEVAGRP
jgi:hypothetical protein